MKKLLLLILPLLAITFNSCSKDDDGDKVDYNKFTINGQTDEFISGNMYYYGNGYGEDAVNVDLYLECKNGASIDVEMFVPNGNTKLVAGTYNFNDNHAAFTHFDGYIEIRGVESDFDITGGTIKIVVSGDIYTITVDVTLTGVGTAKGTYKGTLTWEDQSE